MTRPSRLLVMLSAVDESRTVRVTLEFEQDSDPLCGQLLAGQAVYPFEGWLGLAVALEHVIGPSAPGAPGWPSPPASPA